jgi:methylated-DNA-protein-cysteine methyltransferase-like protein
MPLLFNPLSVLPIITPGGLADKAAGHHHYVGVRLANSFPERVRRIIRDLERGEVVSYSEVARRAGYPRAARAVGNVLARSTGLPWWRVVRADGSLAASSREEQARRLRREGVRVKDGRVRANLSSGKLITKHRR